MYNTLKKEAEHSFLGSLASATDWFQKNFRKAGKAMAALSVFIGVVVSAAMGGNIGTVKMGYTSYVPFHEISLQNAVVYAAGLLFVALAGLFWNGKAFSVIGGGFSLSRKDVAFSGLRFLQGCMLSFFVFGIIAVAIAVAAVKVAAWLWAVFALYVLFVSVPLYIVEYDYMLADHRFRESLRLGLKAVREQWGRVFFRVLFVNAVAIVLMAVVMLPAVALMLSIYDNATAVVMDGAAPTPSIVFVLEYVFMAAGCVAALGIRLWALVALKRFFDDSCAYSAQLAENDE